MEKENKQIIIFLICAFTWAIGGFFILKEMGLIDKLEQPIEIIKWGFGG